MKEAEIPEEDKRLVDLAVKIARYENEKAKELFKEIFDEEFDPKNPKHVAILYGGGSFIDIVDKIYGWLKKQEKASN